MAINFSASIAAYIAAGVNVPRRQFMYWISQETGQPYVLNKDGMERMQSYGPPGSHYAPVPPQNPPPNGYNLAAQQQQQSQQQSSAMSSQQHPQPNAASPERRGIPADKNSSTQTEASSRPSQSSITSPVTSPYPSANCSVTGGDDEQMASQQTSANSPDTHASDGSERNPHCDMSYYSRNHVLSPGSFMSYLKQPGVMLTPLNPAEASGDFPNMPELLNHQGGGGASGLSKSGHHKILGTVSSGGGGSNDDASRLFKCLECDKSFKQKSTLQQHERIHSDARPFACVDCGKRFRQQSHLTQHQRIHANEKPFACSYCNKMFRQRAILNQHMRIHSGEKPYVCAECGKRFRQKAILNQHIRTHQADSFPATCPTTHFLTAVIGDDDVDGVNEEGPGVRHLGGSGGGGVKKLGNNVYGHGMNLARRDEKTDAALSTTLKLGNKGNFKVDNKETER